MSDLAQAKEAKILSARTLAGWAIDAEYPSYKQLNISRLAVGYTQADQQAMAERIDAVRAQRDGYEAAIAAAASQQTLDAIAINYGGNQ